MSIEQNANITIASDILSRLEYRGSGIAFAHQKEIGGYRVLTWQEYQKKALALSHYLQKEGVQKGDCVLILSENCPEWVIAAIAILNLGAILVPVAAVSTLLELESILENSRAKFCFFSKLALAYKLISKDKLPKHLAWDSQEKEPLEKYIINTSPEFPVNPNLACANDIALLIFTSGTTGTPKAVPLSHKNILTNTKDILEVVEANEYDVVLSVLPLSHMLEFTGGLMLPSTLGARVVYVKSMRSEDILRAIQENGCTILLAVPLLFEVIARNIEQKINSLPIFMKTYFSFARKITRQNPNLGKILLYPIHRNLGGRLRFFVAGGAKLQTWAYDFFASIGVKILQGYGLTETSPVLAVSSLENTEAHHVGKPLRHVELRIVDEKGRDVAHGSEGEVWARGDSVFTAYVSKDHTEQAFSDGWFHTGDLARYTLEGYVEITGRKKDIIVTPGGKNVYPEELENILSRNEKFLEVCVLGMKDEEGHEKVVAVLRPNHSKFSAKISDQDLHSAVENEVSQSLKVFSDYMQPQKIILWEREFPKTHTRKVKRFELRQQIEEQASKSNRSEENASEYLDLNNSLQKTLAEVISAITKKPVEKISRNEKLQSGLGLDSLTFVEIIGSIEKKFAIKIDSIEFSNVERVDDLVQILGVILTQQGKSVATLSKTPAFSEFHPMAGLRPQWLIPRLLFQRIFQIILFFYCRIESQGKEKIDTNESYIFAANHTSHFDSISIVSTLPISQSFRSFAVAAKDYFFNSGWKSFSFRLLLNAIPFDRKKRVDEGMRKCREIVENGGSLIIFPEGTRSITGKIQKFKPGVGSLLCANRNVKAVPVYIDGAYQVFPKGARFPKPNKIRVIYGEPIDFQNLEPSPANYTIVAEQLEKAVIELKKTTDQSK